MWRSIVLVCLVATAAFGQEHSAQPDTTASDARLAAYFSAETTKLSEQCLTDDSILDHWQAKRPEYKRQLLEMLGLQPLPEKTKLHVEVTGITEQDEFTVRKLHFQSRPGLYVTANLYVPRVVEEPLPAILYVCGHGRVKIDGVSYGNKVHYQHHPAWFARNGYVCLTIDTLQLGEIEGLHHGTHREGMWWWLNRGYTPAGVEAWNCVRAIDLLQSLPEVDGERIGVTGRSGGGAYSWWVSAIDERIKCAVPVAGITDLENHVVDGCVEGHCDCMFMVNTYRWDYPMLAAMVAPRPLLISNTDSDGIFPLDGVYRTHQKVKRLYSKLGKKNNVAFHITAGPHKDTQELRVHAFRWFNQHLKGDSESPVLPAKKFFEPAELQVLKSMPSDQTNTRIHEDFVAAAEPGALASGAEWAAQRSNWLQVLREKSFRGWPTESSPLNLSTTEPTGSNAQTLEFDSQPNVRLKIQLVGNMDSADTIELRLVGEGETADLNARPASDRTAIAWFAPRGIGADAWNPNQKKQTQIRRRFYLLGQTLDGMQVYDVRRALAALRELNGSRSSSLHITGKGVMAGIAVYAALFEPTVDGLKLRNLPATHRDGPILLNVRRYFDMPQALAMACTGRDIHIEADADDFEYSQRISQLTGHAGKLRFSQPNSKSNSQPAASTANQSIE